MRSSYHSNANSDLNLLRTWLIAKNPTILQYFYNLRRKRNRSTDTPSTEGLVPPPELKAGINVEIADSDDVLGSERVQAAERNRVLNSRPFSFFELYDLHWSPKATDSWRLQRCRELLPLLQACYWILNSCTFEFTRGYRFGYCLTKFDRIHRKCNKRLADMLSTASSVRYCCMMVKDVLETIGQRTNFSYAVSSALLECHIDAECLLRKGISMMMKWITLRNYIEAFSFDWQRYIAPKNGHERTVLEDEPYYQKLFDYCLFYRSKREWAWGVFVKLSGLEGLDAYVDEYFIERFYVALEKNPDGLGFKDWVGEDGRSKCPAPPIVTITELQFLNKHTKYDQ